MRGNKMAGSQKVLWLLFLFIALLISEIQAGAATNKVELKKEKWEKSAKGKNYIETFKERETTKQPTRKHRPRKAFDTSWLKYLVYFIVAAALVYLIYRIVEYSITIVGVQKSNPLVSRDLSKIEDDILSVDLEEILAKALASNNYYLALRIRYLIILKTLNSNSLIVWKKNKTNGEYLFEMKNSNLFPEFQRTTYIFEKVWYGDFNITKDDYYILFPMFESLISKVAKNEN